MRWPPTISSNVRDGIRPHTARVTECRCDHHDCNGDTFDVKWVPPRKDEAWEVIRCPRGHMSAMWRDKRGNLQIDGYVRRA